MDIQSILTFTIDSVVLISLIFLVVDFYFLMLNSWQQLSPSSSKPDFYQQVKDIFQDDAQPIISAT